MGSLMSNNIPQQSNSAPICGVVLTKNEERHIAGCLDTLRWVDELIVFDSFSTDQTVELAIQSGARVIQHQFENFAQQRNAALAAVSSPWVFFLDADERCTEDLAREIRAAVQAADHAVWSTPRDNYLFGHLMRGAGYYPDYQARLFQVGHAMFDPGREVHELPIFEGQPGYLKHTLIHYNYETVNQFHDKQRLYSELDARILYKQDVRPKSRNYVLQPVREFYRRYVTLQGYRDGLPGLRLCVLLAYYTLDKYRRLHRMWQVRSV